MRDLNQQGPIPFPRLPFGAVLLGVLLGVGLLAGTTTAQSPRGDADYLTSELRTEVEALERAASEAPTTPENIVERTRVLWAWANAYTVAGFPIHPDLSSSVARILDPNGLNRNSQKTLPPRVDGWIEEFSYREDNPGALGTLSSPNLGPFPADGYATFTQVLRVGSAGIGVGGGVMITPIAYGRSSSTMQWDDPTADDFVRAYTSNPGVELEVTTAPMTGMTSGGLRGVDVPRPVFEVVRGQLVPGDTVTIVLGDRSSGSRGIRTPTMSSSGLRIKLWLRLEKDGVFFPFDELPFVVEGGATAGVRGFAPTVVGVGESFDLLVRSEDVFRNRSTSDFPGYELLLDGKVLHTVPAASGAIHTLRGLSLDAEGAFVYQLRSLDGRFQARVNPIVVEQDPDQRVFWGETHGHSGFAEGMGTVDGFFEFARDDAKLDFMTLSEHDLWLDDSEWQVLLDAVGRHHRPGEFVTFAGYEWTQHARAGGHHNVLFRTPDNRRRVERQRAPRLLPLWTLLLEENAEEDVVVIPHAHNPGNWWNSDGRVERLIEIVSNHGTFEWLGQAYLAEGHKTGFIGGSDDHIGHPGLRPLWKAFGSDNRGGLAGVVASEKSRESIFDSLRSRNSYATNGERIFLDVDLNGSQMGSMAGVSEQTRFAGRVVGTAPIESITVVKNGRELETMSFAEPEDRTRFVEIGFYSQTDPEERKVWSRGARVWRGTLRTKGAPIQGIDTPNVENIFTESADLNSRGTVDFEMRTRGSFRSIVLELGKGQLDRVILELDSNPRGAGEEAIEHGFDAEALQNGGALLVLEEGDFTDMVRARFVDPPTEFDRSFEVIDPQGRAGDSYYVRVTQWNGGMAWSSPIWLSEK